MRVTEYGEIVFRSPLARIDGYWLTCDDGVSRPVVDAHVVGQNDAAFYDLFLVDIDADRTVFSAHLARRSWADV